MDKNYPNKKFWTENPMTYVDFKKPLKQRLPKTKKDYQIINKKIIRENPDFLEIIKKIKKKITNKNVLDLGCGFGSSSIVLSKYAKKIFAIDLTLPAIKHAKKNVRLNKRKNIFLKQVDAEKMKFPKNFFDFVFSWGVIHHSSNPNKIYKNIYKNLKPNGQFFMMVYNLYSFRYIFFSNYYLFLKRKIFKGYDYTTIGKKFTDGHYNKHYKKGEIKKILKNIGFKNIEVKVGHHRGRILPFLKSHNSFLGKFLSRRFGYFLYIYCSK